MHHKLYKVISVAVSGSHKLLVDFDDGSRRDIDFLPVLKGELYGPLRDLELFKQVKIDPEVNTLVWPNGADFDPATLHDWPEDPQIVRDSTAHWQNSEVTPVQR